MNKLLINRRKIIRIIGLSLIGSIGYGSYHYLNKKLIKTTWDGTVLNSPARLEIHSESKKNNLIIIEKIKKLVFTFDNIFNLQNTNSEIVKLNKLKISFHNISIQFFCFRKLSTTTSVFT